MTAPKDFLEEALAAADKAAKKRLIDGYAWHAQVLANEVRVLRDELEAAKSGFIERACECGTTNQFHVIGCPALTAEPR